MFALKLENFQKIKTLDVTTNGAIYEARNKKTGRIVAIKKHFNFNEFQNESFIVMREIFALCSLHHPNIIELEGVVQKEKSFYLALEYISMDLKKYIKSLRVDEEMNSELIRRISYQIIDAMAFCHSGSIAHQNLKPQNVRITKDNVVKITGFHLSKFTRHVNETKKEECPIKMIELWYRPPETILGSTYISWAADIWSIGCIIAEMATKQPLFNGNSEADQLLQIFNTLRTPTVDICIEGDTVPDFEVSFPSWKRKQLADKLGNFAEHGIDLLNNMLTYDPKERIPAKEAIHNRYFHGLRSLNDL